jgi:hypothetical protein
MFGKSDMVKVFGSIAVAASIAVVGARTAHAQTFITDTLGGNGHAKVSSVQGYRFITDTLGGSGRPSYNTHAYVEGGASQALAKAIQSFGRNEQSPAPSVVPSTGEAGSSWRNVGIGAGSAACLMLLLACGLVLRSNRHRVAAA